MPNAEPVYCFIHIGKTGGTTINAHLYQQLAWDEEFIHIGPWGNQYRKEHGRAPIGQRSEEELQRVRVISGHGVRFGTHRMVGRPGRYFTILRDPADRLLSAYNYKRRLGTQNRAPFEEWVTQLQPNGMFRTLKKRLEVEDAPALKKRLRRFWFVGTTENLDADLAPLFRTLGVSETWRDRRVTGGGTDMEDMPVPDAGLPIPAHATLTDELRHYIYARNRRDLHLYQLAQRLRQRAPFM